MTTPKRPTGSRETENENLRTPATPGTPPRPATEPPGSEWSTKSAETATDPATGEPIKKADVEPKAPAKSKGWRPLLTRLAGSIRRTDDGPGRAAG